jgi:lactoylglutathione lyase
MIKYETMFQHNIRRIIIKKKGRLHMHFHHLAIRVKNLEESIAFYETVTELKISRRFNYEPAEIAYMANCQGATEIELIYFPNQPTFQGSGMTVCFETDKLDEMHALVTSKGLNPSDIRNPDPENRYFFVYDPNGVSIQLKQIL